MTALPDKIRAMEKRLKKQDITVQDFCDHVRLDRSTWTRWKAGISTPNVERWERTESAFNILTQGADKDEN